MVFVFCAVMEADVDISDTPLGEADADVEGRTDTDADGEGAGGLPEGDAEGEGEGTVIFTHLPSGKLKYMGDTHGAMFVAVPGSAQPNGSAASFGFDTITG